MKVLVITGSRADYGLLEWPIKTLKEDPFFTVDVLNLWGLSFEDAHAKSCERLDSNRPDYVLVLGDRFEILSATIAAHLRRIPIAHIAGGDVTLGSYDDAMRDCISRMARTHFVTNADSLARLEALNYSGLHLVGSPGIDYILNGSWKTQRPCSEPYVVVSYQAETADGTNEIGSILETLPNKRKFFCIPNRDRGNEEIYEALAKYISGRTDAGFFTEPGHDAFLNLLAHCDEFIGNSSAILYEAPVLGIKTRLIGNRQAGRVVPFGDGKASQRIAEVLKAA